MSTVKIRDVAAAAGLAESSVSRILNSTPGYSYDERTRERVRQVAWELGYQANAAARLLKQQKKNLVALTAHLTEHPYLTRLMAAVRDELICRGYEPVLVEPYHFLAARSNSPFPSVDMLVGILSFGDEHQSKSLMALRNQLPIVALHSSSSRELDGVYTDLARGGELMVDHLVSLGHRRIAFAEVTGSTFNSDRLKLKGWKRAVRRHMLDTKQLSFIEISVSDSITTRAERLEAALMASKVRPTALICTGDESALCVMGKLQERSWKIPRDISICGYDGISFGEYCYPRLTTILQPVESIALAGVERLLALVEQGQQDSAPRQQLIEPQLLVRNSTAKPPVS